MADHVVVREGSVGGGEEPEDGPIRPAAAAAGPADHGVRRRLLLVVAASVVAVGVGAATVVHGPMVVGWYVLVGAAVVLVWSAAQLLPRRLRAAAIAVAGVVASGALLAWTPTLGGMGSATWFGWLGLLCLAALAVPVALLLSEGFKLLLGERRVVALTATLVAVALAVLVAQPAALKIRFIARQPEFDEVASRLLTGEDGPFDGIDHPTGAEPISGDDARMEPVPSVAGVPVVFGSVESDPARVHLCLPGTVAWSCTNELLYAPGADLDGDRAGWNIDCDLVTRRLSGDWYLRSMECPRT